MKYKICGIDHVQIAIPAEFEDKARDFYIEKLGFIEIPKPVNLQKNGGFWLQLGIHQLHIGIMNNFSPSTKAHPAFEILNLVTSNQN